MSVLTKDSQETQKVLSKLVAKAWLDEEFKQRFILEPATVLQENGLPLPSDAEVRVTDNSSLETPTNTTLILESNGVYEITLPPKSAELTDSQIQSWVEGDNAEASVVGCF